MTAAVALRGATLGAGGRAVLCDISFTLHAGEFVGLLGPNGAGKTTLLRALAGLVRPRAGEVSVLGQAARPGIAGVAWLPQTGGAAPPSVAACDLLWAGRPDGVTGADIAASLAETGAAPFAARALDTLSGGERQRVLIAQALLGRPRLLLLDEPLAGLDPAQLHGMVALLRRLQRARGLCVLCSAHDIDPLLPAMDRVLYLGGGGAAIGTVDAVVTAPVLSRLYGTPMRALRQDGHVVVVPEIPPGSRGA